MTQPRTSLKLNLNADEVVSLDGGRIRLSLRKRSGRRSSLHLDLALDVRVDREPQQQTDPQAAQVAPGLV